MERTIAMSHGVGLYLLGKKGYSVLSSLLGSLDTSEIRFVVGGRDAGIADDYFEQIKSLATRNQIDFFSREDLSKNHCPAASIQFAIGWKWLLPPDEFLVVFHDSVLPKYRGFAPLVNSLISGEDELGVTALLAVEKYDAGPIVSQASVTIDYPLKISAAIELVCPLYSQLALSVYTEFVKTGRIASTAQDEEQATYSPWRDSLDYHIPWTESATYIKRFCDAVGHPYDGALTFVDDAAIRVFEVSEVEDFQIVDRDKHVGKIIEKRNGKPIVICGRGLLQIDDAVVDETGMDAVPTLRLRTRFTADPALKKR
jgi:methionyl-tRNA formyltransferase